MIYDVLIAGGGLSSMAFLTSYAKTNKKIYVISPIRKKRNILKANSHITKNLPPQYLNKKNEIDNYFYWNKLKVNRSSYLIGSLGYGGLSNTWGYQIEKNFNEDISHFSKKNRNLIKESFNFFFSNTKNRTISKSGIFNKILNTRFKNFFFNKVDIAKLNNKKSFTLNEKNKMNSKNFYNYYLKNKNIIFLDFVIKSIQKKKNLVELNVIDSNNVKKKIYAKKLVLATGTIITTKLVSDYLKMENEIKIKHHPRLILSFLSKKPIFLKKKIESELKVFSKTNKNFVMDFRSNANSIMKIIKKNFNSIIVDLFLDIFKNKLIFSNVFLTSKYSNLYMKKESEYTVIFSKKNNKKKNKINKIKNIVLELKNDLINKNIILPFYKTFIPDAGADYHYFGSITVSKKKFGINENCQLNANKNIYIIDGSSIDYKNTFFPMGVIMANARRIGFLV